MRHTAFMFCKDLDLFVIDPYRVREPYVVPHPIYFLHIGDRAMTEFLQTELFLVFGLCEVSM